MQISSALKKRHASSTDPRYPEHHRHVRIVDERHLTQPIPSSCLVSTNAQNPCCASRPPSLLRRTKSRLIDKFHSSKNANKDVFPSISPQSTRSSHSGASPTSKLRRFLRLDQPHALPNRFLQFDGSPESISETDLLESTSRLPLERRRPEGHSSDAENTPVGTAAFAQPQTVVRRLSPRLLRPAISRLIINPHKSAKSYHGQRSAPINYSSSSALSPYDNSGASPVSKASTGQTSVFQSGNSAKSQKSLDLRLHQDQRYSPNRHLASCAEELAPINESGVRLLHIPCQEALSSSSPSVTTIEAVTAAKIFFETYYDGLMTEHVTPRSLRRRRLQQKLWETSLDDEDRKMHYETWCQAESDHLRQVRVLKSSSLARHESKGVSIAGYETVRILGKGSFGVVKLVRERTASESSDSIPDDQCTHTERKTGDTPTGAGAVKDVFAMKVIRKSEMLRNCQEGHLRAERDLLVASEGSRWIVPLLASFQDNTNLYLVMEYMLGGDFLGMLLREDMLDEWVAR